jgi:hypothetical protein
VDLNNQLKYLQVLVNARTRETQNKWTKEIIKIRTENIKMETKNIMKDQ